MNPKDSVVLLQSREADKNSAFGSAFLIARDHGYSYLLTCAHVVEQINGKGSGDNKLKIFGLDETVEVVKCGAGDSIDMALLRVEGLLDKPLLDQFARGQRLDEIRITGFSLFDAKQYVQRELSGRLGNPIELTVEDHACAAWDITIQGDSFAKLEGGYSGSPLYNAENQVVGVVSHRRSGDTGHAFCISNLKKLYPEVAALLPNLENLSGLSRIARINTGLLKRMTEIAPSYMGIAKRLKQLDQKKSLDEEDDIVLERCEDFIARRIPPDAFKAFFCNLPSPTQTQRRQPNYKLLAQRLNNGEIALCLGSELPASFDPNLQPAVKLVEQIAAIAKYAYAGRPALSEVCEYAELNSGECTRNLVVAELKKLSSPPSHPAPNMALYDLLCRLDKPFLAIDSGFDNLLRQHLRKSGRKFVSIVPLPGDEPAQAQAPQKLMLHYSDREAAECNDEQLSALQLMDKDYTLIYHPRGYLEGQEDTLLLAERDYFNASYLLDKKYPDSLRNKLKGRGCGLWFLGYAPDSWETRLLAKVLLHQRRDGEPKEPALVIQPSADVFSQLFWRHLTCDLHDDIGTSEFVDKIGAAL